MRMLVMRLHRPKRAEPQVGHQPVANSALESLFDLLHRDQRTILTINRESRNHGGVSGAVKFDFGFGGNSRLPFASDEISNSSPEEFAKKLRTRSRGPRRKLACLGHLVKRLAEVFIVGVCLLTIVRVPAVMSAPSTRHAKATEPMHSQNPTEDKPSYLHPCGKSFEEKMNNTNYQAASKETDQNILKHLIIRAKNALSYAQSFRKSYVEETFHIHLEVFLAKVSLRYDWLPDEEKEIPKKLGKKVSHAHLSNRTFDESLINIYEYLQKYAVGLEQIVADQKRLEGNFRENFRNMEVFLRNLLCEIRMAMIERNVTPRNPVLRSIMKEELRNTESISRRNFRDWIIFRGLMNCLEYAIEVFVFIEENLPQSSTAASS